MSLERKKEERKKGAVGRVNADDGNTKAQND
jgi:hypothetical protein